MRRETVPFDIIIESFGIRLEHRCYAHKAGIRFTELQDQSDGRAYTTPNSFKKDEVYRCPLCKERFKVILTASNPTK